MKKHMIHCIEHNCTKSSTHSLPEKRVVPFEIEHKEICKLLSYFLHRAPNISSVHSPNIDASQHDMIFTSMMEGRHFKYQGFCAFNVTIEKELNKGHLNGDSICLNCKRFVCKRCKPKKHKPPETNLSCFLRHIRNAIAHGRVYYFHGGNKIHLIFEDQNSTKKLSARILCIKADLEHWKKILSQLTMKS